MVEGQIVAERLELGAVVADMARRHAAGRSRCMLAGPGAFKSIGAAGFGRIHYDSFLSAGRHAVQHRVIVTRRPKLACSAGYGVVFEHPTPERS